MAKKKLLRSRKGKSLFEKLRHLLEKRGQGLPMTTVVIIVIVLIVLSVVTVFFFGQFSTGQQTVKGQQEIGVTATQNAKCSAWASGILPAKPCGATAADGACPKQAICDYFLRTDTAEACWCIDCTPAAKLFTPTLGDC
ncbi:MAG: hypothetical protein PHC66_03725 [Candidatus Nanoarchaeia archaeon]|nr:hypothetical protein [Candidatus Nanoarchaeia archaeon]MDD5239204.1 hypothetical protein [Candidatus Nanoarchaeia archaeon]